MLVITNIENGNFSADLTSVILRDATIQNKFITNILQTAEKYGMRDIHFDFESVAPEDREAYNRFTKCKTRLPRVHIEHNSRTENKFKSKGKIFRSSRL